MIKRVTHPFLSGLKRYVANKTLGPIVIATSTMIGIHPRLQKQCEQIQDKQRKLSEVTDMIHAAHVFHRCVLEELPPPANKLSTCNKGLGLITKTSSVHQDNVMSLLLGDYLLAQSSVDMAELGYPKTVGLIAKALENYTKGEFLLYKMLTQKQDMNGTTQEKLIETHAELTCGSLLSNACHSATLLAGYYDDSDPKNKHLLEEIQKFGLYMGTAQRLLELFFNFETIDEDGRYMIKNLDDSYFKRSITNLLDNSLSVLYSMPDCESRLNLIKIIEEMNNRTQDDTDSYKRPD